MKPQLDHLTQYHVEGVKKLDDGFVIEMEGGAQIINEKGPVPDKSLVGLVLTRVTLSSTDTVAYFGDKATPDRVAVHFVPTDYAIRMRARGETVYPQRSDVENNSVPADPSPERVAEGPQEPAGDAESTEDGQSDA